jgi:Cu+-exporting ATPase
MHREISHADETFGSESKLSLYLLTGLLGLLIAADLWPTLAAWLSAQGIALPTWPNSINGYRIALAAAVIGGARIVYGSLESLLDGRIGADLALAIACVAAILIGEPLVAAEIVFIGMLGECLENITFQRTQEAIRKIVEVFPLRCWLIRDGQEVRVLTRDLKVGDRVLVKPGGKIPVDGIVVDGHSSVDTSALTGESLPIERGAGEPVLAGSINQFGALTIEARQVAEHTVAGRVIEMTARALKEKGKAERTADRLARLFLPMVLGLAGLTFFAGILYYSTTWFRPADAERFGLGYAARTSLYPTLAVLVVACPCALILATPAAVIAALGRLAGTGILIKRGSALERLAQVGAIAFDKTGTLTEGKLELGDVVPLGGAAPDDLLRTTATAEQRSEHVLAKLILQAAAARNLAPEPADEFLAHPGAGVSVRTAGHSLLVGTRRLLQEHGISVPAEADTVLQQLDSGGQTALLVARDGVVLGAIGARDRLRPEAVAVLAELRQMGIGPISMLTGDRRAVAAPIAEALQIDEVHAELLPEQKAKFLDEWKKKLDPKRAIAMVGDGINDAPALARADVGLAISGTDIAAEAGDVVLLGDPLRHLPLLLRLSRETARIIHQNIVVFAFGVNIVGIVGTAWLLPLLAPQWREQSPIVAVVYHQLGSLAVLLNAMRLLWFERSSTSAFWLRGKHLAQRADNALGHLLDLDELVHWLSHHWKPLTGAFAGLLLAGWVLSGLTIVNADEVAVVRRFGRPIDRDLKPGLYWRCPWPIDDVTKIQPDRVRFVEIGYRQDSEVGKSPVSSSWSSRHGDGILPVPEEAVMITGDNNLEELQATVLYSISEPRVYLFEVSEPEKILRALTESTLREVSAGRRSSNLLTSDREYLQQEVMKRLDRSCQAYGEHGLGIKLDALAVHDLHPPQKVVDSYHDVARALEDRERTIIDAGKYGHTRVRNAQIQQAELKLQAETNRTVTIRTAETDRDCFRMQYDLKKAYPELTEFLLYWNLQVLYFQPLEKMLIDAEVQATRIYFHDSEQSSAPWMVPFDRGPVRPRGQEGAP